ncbi:MAG: acyltransferase family protein [Ruminococcus sp.]
MSNLWQSPTGMFYGNLTINVLLMSVAMFVFAKKHLNKLPKSKKREDRLAFFSKCSFGVYLIHVIFIQGLSKIFNITSLSFNPVISVPLLSVTVFLLSMIISAILNKLPFIKKWLV